MKIQFDNKELIEVTRSPYASNDRLIMYFVAGQLPAEQIVAEAKVAENVYFYVNDAVLATYKGYTVFNSLLINDTELTLTMINPEPEREDEDTSEYAIAAKILLGEEGV